MRVSERRFRIIADICRIVLGAVFVFSGFVKSIDPWGTALKIEEYLVAFGTEGLTVMSGALAVGQCALELSLGLMLIFKAALKAASLLTMLFMAFFTALTLVIAVWNPVDDCGCFGEALKLSNWMTFAKNALLLPMSLILWEYVRKRQSSGFKRRDLALTSLFAVAAITLNLYSWYFLPPVDSFAYRKGTDLRTEVLCTSCIPRSMALVYEDTVTGERREFGLSDTTWYDATRWRYIDTRTAYDDLPPEAQEYDFALWRRGADRAEEIIYRSGDTYMIMIRNAGRVSARCRENIKHFVSSAGESDRLIYVEGTSAEGDTVDEISVAGRTVPVYGMDRRLMAQILRADAGVVRVTDGVVTGKRPCRGMERIRRTPCRQ